MKFALDTNRYRDFCVGDPVAVDRIQLAEQIFLPFVTSDVVGDAIQEVCAEKPCTSAMIQIPSR